MISDAWLNSFMWQIYFQSNLNLLSAGSSVQMLIQGKIICDYERICIRNFYNLQEIIILFLPVSKEDTRVIIAYDRVMCGIHNYYGIIKLPQVSLAPSIKVLPESAPCAGRPPVILAPSITVGKSAKWMLRVSLLTVV